MQLTQGQLQVLAAAVGMKDPKTMAAIAMAESNGNTNAHNATPPDDSYGLWQINMLGEMGPARRRQFGISKNTDLYNPFVNARAAKMIQDSQGLKAWSTYTSGAYEAFLGKPVDAVPADWWDELKEGWDKGPWGDNPERPDWVPEQLDPTDNALTGMLDFIARAGDWLSDPTNWVRVVYVAGGAALVIGGLVLVARPLLDAAAASTPVGTVAKVAKGAAK